MNTEMQSRIDFTEFSAGQRSLLSKKQGRIASLIDKALDRFYAKVRRTPETSKFFRDQSHMEGAKRAQQSHWARIASGQFDDGFHDSVRRIGSVHARIGLEPRWYIGAYALVLEELLRDIGRSPIQRLLGRRSPEAELSIALVKAALLDMELSVSIYFEEAQRDREEAIRALEDALETLSRGELSRDLAGLPDSFRKLELSYNTALASLRQLIGSVTESTDAIRSGANEISQASEDLARRTESTAASLEQTSASLIEVEQRVKATAGAASQTVVRADQAIGTVGTGRKMAEGAVEAMERVSDSTENIDAVIEGLDKIAFQTRVLAMNAAVEAGRAGEAGRGFAVVADLVSALAMRAEEESQNAREQLTLTQTDIASAVDAVRNVDGALADISTGVGEVHELLGAMATDNQAQSVALSQVSVAIGEMDKSTQQNAAMVEETSAAARNLSAQVDALGGQTARFNIGSDTKKSNPSANVHALVVPAAGSADLPLMPPSRKVSNGHAVSDDAWNGF